MDELFSDPILQQESYEELMKTQNVLAYKQIVASDIRGGVMQLGSSNSSIHADPKEGFWMGHANFGQASVKISMAGSLTASGGTITGGTLRTSSNPNRVAIEGSTNRFAVYNNNAAIATLDSDGVAGLGRLVLSNRTLGGNVNLSYTSSSILNMEFGADVAIKMGRTGANRGKFEAASGDSIDLGSDGQEFGILQTGALRIRRSGFNTGGAPTQEGYIFHSGTNNVVYIRLGGAWHRMHISSTTYTVDP